VGKKHSKMEILQRRRVQMTDKMEISAKTIEEAIELGLKELDAERGEVAVEVISEGRAGIFGIGGEQPRIRVTRLTQQEGLAGQAMDVINHLISAMEVSVVATVRFAGDEKNGPAVDIQGEDSGLLIGKRGETLGSLQFLVNLLLNSVQRNHPLVVVDVEGYKERRARALESIVHMSLAEHPSVTTESAGEGNQRRVTVMPRRDK
jgi:spoIIIJ-associated protein